MMACNPIRHLGRLGVNLFHFGLIFGAAHAASPSSLNDQRATFAHSISAVATTATDANGRPNRAFVTRTALTADESAALMPFEVALTMRNFAELEARLAHSEIISPAEMQARYLPLAAAHDRVVQWLQAEGLQVTRTDANHLAVFGRASVAEVARVFQTTFACVAADGAEFTSAITAPSLPAPLAPTIRGVHGLQPHQRLRRHSALRPLVGTDGSLPYYPAQVAKAYNAANLGRTGAGQTIAIYALAFPKTTDLASFWKTTGASAVATNIQNVSVAGGPAASPTAGSLEEATLDVEWASAMAPGATIRIYGANENDPVGDDELIQQVIADLPTQPTLHQLTISFGADETTSDRDYIAIEAQYMATLVGAGVTVFASSGDTGALGNNGAIQTDYPASMPDVTAVGGTTLALDTSGNVSSEIAWGNPANSGSTGASGGGISQVFARPTWQTGSGVPAGTQRLVPDVAAVGDPNTGAFVYVNGASAQYGGTSLSSPIWAAWCALFNEARAAAGKAPLGALNPRIYPLAGTSAFRDITSGGNSVYSAGVGYDLCTGLGVPSVAVLLQSALVDTYAPVVEVQSGARFTTVGQGATFYVVTAGNPAPSFRWQRLPVGSATWADLTEGANYAGTKTYALSIIGATSAMNGDQFRCIISNSLSAIVSATDTLTVAAYGVTTLAGWPGWSGFADGQGSAGRFNFTGSVRTDASGNVYVADASNHTIRKITPAGFVSTLAGSPGIAGTADGTGSAARFNGPAGVAIDSAGNVYVADAGNYTIRKITPAGVVTTFAGRAGVPGSTNGTGTAATFADPENLTIDAAGTLYIADGSGNTVRRITPAGVVSTLAGSATRGTADGTGTAARFYLVYGVAVDGAGTVYAADFGNNAVRKITPAGVVTTLAGLAGTRNYGFVDGTGSAARFDAPTGLAVDPAGNVYVADSNNNAVRLISPAGVVTTLTGTASVVENIDGPLALARFNGPTDVALNAQGVLYVADAYNCTVRRVAFPVAAPVITAAPASQTVGIGGSLVLTVAVSGPGPYTYQWNKDGTPITGANADTYTVSAATAATAGNYTVTVTGGGATVTTAAAVVVATADAVASRFTNLSVTTTAGPGAQILTLGFVLSGTPGKTLLIRGVGPGLAAFGVTGTLADPALTVIGPNSTSLVAAANDNWNAADAAAIAATGAFPLTVGSADAALITTLGAGNYSAQISGQTSGLALAEVYDTSIGFGAKLINLSTLAQVPAGGVLIAGFTISGNVAKTVLIRGLGPALTAFGVTSPLADPKLELYDAKNVLLQSNDDWGATSALIAGFAQAGAFSLGAVATKDAALLVTLPPGGYTALVRGAGTVGGTALIEIYEVP